MSIFKRLLGQSSKAAQPTVNNPRIKPKDERKAECPYCHEVLKQIPGSKTKCPHCGRFMYVRTHTDDQIRVVVTEEDANKIDEEWSIVNGTHDEFVAEKQAFEDEREVLRKRFGMEPPENDVKWSIFNKQRLQQAIAGNWGFYRNTTFEMAELLRKEGRHKGALAKYFEVCYLDLNGPENRGGMPQELREEFPFFDPKNAFLAPGVIRLIKTMAKKLSLNETDIKQLFLDQSKRTNDNLKLSVSPEDSWSKIEEQLR